VTKGPPQPPRDDEPEAVAAACERLGLKYVVITSVTRDDLPDGGAGHFARTIAAIRARRPLTLVEVLTPDFLGVTEHVDIVLKAGPDVFDHNVETVPRLYEAVRPRSAGGIAPDYNRSLAVLRHAANAACDVSRVFRPRVCAGVSPARNPSVCAGEDDGVSSNDLPNGMHNAGETPAPRATPAERGRRLFVKSGLMLGLGERDAEIEQTLADLRHAGVDILTLGQYLAPSPHHWPVARFVEPAEFAQWEIRAKAMGFMSVLAGPFVRSSYRAGEILPEGDC